MEPKNMKHNFNLSNPLKAEEYKNLIDFTDVRFKKAVAIFNSAKDINEIPEDYLHSLSSLKFIERVYILSFTLHNSQWFEATLFYLFNADIYMFHNDLHEIIQKEFNNLSTELKRHSYQRKPLFQKDYLFRLCLFEFFEKKLKYYNDTFLINLLYGKNSRFEQFFVKFYSGLREALNIRIPTININLSKVSSKHPKEVQDELILSFWKEIFQNLEKEDFNLFLSYLRIRDLLFTPRKYLDLLVIIRNANSLLFNMLDQKNKDWRWEFCYYLEALYRNNIIQTTSHDELISYLSLLFKTEESNGFSFRNIQKKLYNQGNDSIDRWEIFLNENNFFKISKLHG